jgi:integral membrane protein
MHNLIKTPIGRLRLVGYLEGVSLLALLFVAMPIKYWGGNPGVVKAIGPIHGLLFLWFIVNTISVGVEQHWSFKHTTWKVLVACIIPFGTFYIDRQILKNEFTQHH